MPRSMMRPSRRTTIWSASCTVEVRCEIKMVVRSVHDAAQTGEDAFFGLGVDAGEGIVEDQDARIAD